MYGEAATKRTLVVTSNNGTIKTISVERRIQRNLKIIAVAYFHK
tara:strand:- start:758 stop:889 length:132 start_codon:yes stop_codon:yes gene_type:complete